MATVGIYIPSISTDYPRILHFGPSFFESYHTWPAVKFTHGFNLAKNSSHARKVLIESVPYACKALEGGRLLDWELGNEPDLYSTSSQGPVRPPNWNPKWYVRQWLHWSTAIRAKMAQACPNLATDENYTYVLGMVEVFVLFLLLIYVLAITPRRLLARMLLWIQSQHGKMDWMRTKTSPSFPSTSTFSTRKIDPSLTDNHKLHRRSHIARCNPPRHTDESFFNDCIGRETSQRVLSPSSAAIRQEPEPAFHPWRNELIIQRRQTRPLKLVRRGAVGCGF